MPPRKQDSDPEVVRLLKLNDDYKIHFHPEVTAIDWDRDGSPYRGLIEQISQIQSIKFVQYPSDGHPDREGANQKKLLARRIQANAARCRRERDNEAGWINNVANLVFQRLDGFEFQCQRCRNYLWLPDFVALPSDHIAAERLRRRHASRRLCSCIAAERANVTRVNPRRPSIFSNKSDERVMHGDSGLKDEVLDQKYKRPDRVWGLAATNSFKPFRERLNKFGPFEAGHTLFPFLLVEAKSEKSASGFEHIERQTALSIRTCLKLQIDLDTESNQLLDPVVWFFGFIGDEWRLYLAFMVGDETKVVDCWHGCVVKADDALQLLLIVDWICSWAKDVYREGILRCLAGLTARDDTPAMSGFSSQGDRFEYGQSIRPNSLVFRSSRPPTAAPESFERHPIQSEPIPIEDSEDEIMGDEVPDDGSAVSEDPNEFDVGDLDEQRVVRSACSTVFRWKHLDIPDDETILSELLGALRGFDCLKSAAAYLLRVLMDEEHTSKISLKAVSKLLHDSTEPASEFAREEPIATSIVCQRCLVETSWQVICNFWCITCSQSAAWRLAMIAGIKESKDFSPTYWIAHDCGSLVPVVGRLIKLEGKASAAAAISQDIYCVVASRSETNVGHLEWAKADRTILQTRLVVLESLFRHIEGVRQTTLPLAVSRTASNIVLNPGLFETSGLDDLHGVLLKRPEVWPDSCPLWCFLTFDTAQWESIGMQIATAHAKKAIYAAAEDWNYNDEQFLLRWALDAAESRNRQTRPVDDK